MDILLIRHAIAVEPNAQTDDESRPLTKKGIDRMQEGTRGLAQLVDQVEIIGASPLIRARQTAEIIARAFKPARMLECPELAPGHGPTSATAWIAEHRVKGTLCLIGHEPDLSELVSWLVSGRSEGFLDFKKGGACLLSSFGVPEQGRCLMRWALTPRQLRCMGSVPKERCGHS